MDKNKSEKLKEILSQTLSTEDIQKKLKEEIKNNALKKEKIKEQEKLEQEEEKKIKESTEEKEISKEKNISKKVKQDSQKEDVIIPNVREKKKETQGINILLYLVFIIAILLLVIVIYLFTDNNEKINTNNTNNIVKEEKLDSSSLILITNDEKEKQEEILIPLEKEDKKNINEEEKELDIQTSISDKKNINVKNIEVKEKPKEIIKIKEVVKEKIVTKTIKLDKKNFKEYYNSSKYNSLKCYNFKAGDIFPSSQCKNDLKKFLLANKNAIRFEVVPVISEDDNKIFKKMESNIENMDKDFIIKVKEYMFKGLSRERVLETSWNIKDILGEDTILTPTNYYVKSKKNNKGVIIKAYH